MQTLAILIPIRNGAHVIKNALNSIYNQTAFKKNKFKYQIILVDNNSTDNLKEVINGCENLTYLFCETSGIVPTLNTGVFHIMNLPHVKYIARIDADDLWTENKIDIQFSYMLNHPEIDICGTGIRFIRDNYFREWYYGEKHEQVMADLEIGQNPIAHPSVIYKKDIFYRCGGYDDTYKYNEDFDLWMRASKFYKFHNMQEVLLYYNHDLKSEEYQNIQDTNAKKIQIRNLSINDRLPINRT